jgi:hypothetical protein
MNQNNPLAPSFPRRRESSKIIFREADKTLLLTRYAGIFYQLDSRLRGNDEFFGLMGNLA